MPAIEIDKGTSMGKRVKNLQHKEGSWTSHAGLCHQWQP